MASSEDSKARLTNQVRQLEGQLSRVMEDGDTRAKTRYAELERELEEKSSEFETALAEMQSKSEEQLS